MTAQRLVNGLRKVAEFFLDLTVEPLGLFIFLAFHIYMTVIQDGIYQIVCYRLHGDSINCITKDFEEDDETKIQIDIAMWSQVLMLSFMIPGAISSIIYGSWGDMAGRKINLMLAICGMTFGITPMSYNLTNKSASLWIPVVLQTIGGSFGFLSLIMVSSMAYLSDTIADKETLSIRMVCFAVLMSVANVIGSLVSGVLMELMGLPAIIVLIQVLLALGFFYALFRLEQIPPKHMLKFMQDKKDKRKNLKLKTIDCATNEQEEKINKIARLSMNKQNQTNEKIDLQKKQEKTEESCSKTFLIAVKRAFDLVMDVIRTYTKRRTHQRQAFLLVITAVMFTKMCVDTGLVSQIMGQYVFKKPFQWTGSELGYWKAVGGACNFVGSMAGILIFKKVFKFRDTTIMLIAMVSAAAELLTLGLATESYILYIANAAGALSSLTMPVSMSFITQLIEPDEVGKAFVMQGLVTNISFIVSSLIFTNLYALTISFYAGLVFLIGAGVMVICFCILLWIHFASIRQDKIHVLDSANKIVDEVPDIETVKF